MAQKEQIIEILAEFFTAGIDAQEIGMPLFDQVVKTEHYKKNIDKILSLCNEGYPKEFWIWFGEKGVKKYPNSETQYVIVLNGISRFATITELYDFWKLERD